MDDYPRVSLPESPPDPLSEAKAPAGAARLGFPLKRSAKEKAAAPLVAKYLPPAIVLVGFILTGAWIAFLGWVSLSAVLAKI
jgi:hypothetical protein